MGSVDRAARVAFAVALALSASACTLFFDRSLEDAGDGATIGPSNCAVTLAPGISSTSEPSERIPALGTTFRDPTFGTCVTRISDATVDGHDGLDGGGFLNVDGSLYLTTQGSY